MPVVDAPVLSTMTPLPPLLVVPELKLNAPLTPFVPASADDTLMAPLVEAVPTPAERTKAPPVLATPLPPVTLIAPPTSDALLPAATVTAPPVVPLEEPAVMLATPPVALVPEQLRVSKSSLASSRRACFEYD